VDEDGELENEYNLTGLLDDLDEEFLKSILEDYSMSLQREYEYINSKENLLEVIDCNDYTFNVNGQLEAA
jgi:predicted hydrolase (HD superfamily)